MRAIIVANLAVAMLLTATFAANAQKAKPAACDLTSCIARCSSTNSGGQPRFCSSYCQKQINSNPKCR
ncbi:MAG: hypothetical protein ACR2K5_01845 [Pseudolabrys sp.]